MISYITTPIIVVAALLTIGLKLSWVVAATFSFTVGAMSILIAAVEIIVYKKRQIKSNILAADAFLQSITGVCGIICGFLLLALV